ncbi:hypothetical protein BVRB_036080, partial [Beta vulgaris subsp. vulgaris]
DALEPGQPAAPVRSSTTSDLSAWFVQGPLICIAVWYCIVIEAEIRLVAAEIGMLMSRYQNEMIQLQGRFNQLKQQGMVSVPYRADSVAVPFRSAAGPGSSGDGRCDRARVPNCRVLPAPWRPRRDRISAPSRRSGLFAWRYLGHLSFLTVGVGGRDQAGDSYRR